jgi:hypothetical protein
MRHNVRKYEAGLKCLQFKKKNISTILQLSPGISATMVLGVGLSVGWAKLKK